MPVHSIPGILLWWGDGRILLWPRSGYLSTYPYLLPDRQTTCKLFFPPFYSFLYFSALLPLISWIYEETYICLKLKISYYCCFKIKKTFQSEIILITVSPTWMSCSLRRRTFLLWNNARLNIRLLLWRL